jgi:hypothetical protein
MPSLGMRLVPLSALFVLLLVTSLGVFYRHIFLDTDVPFVDHGLSSKSAKQDSPTWKHFETRGDCNYFRPFEQPSLQKPFGGRVEE